MERVALSHRSSADSCGCDVRNQERERETDGRRPGPGSGAAEHALKDASLEQTDTRPHSQADKHLAATEADRLTDQGQEHDQRDTKEPAEPGRT